MFLELCSHTSQNRHGCRFRSNAYKDVCLLRWRTYRKPISEFLEHLASHNGADMYKHYTLYTTGNPQKDYQDLFIQDDLNGNPEMIFHRHYVLDKLTHNMVCATAGSMTKSLIESFLCADGTPVALNPDTITGAAFRELAENVVEQINYRNTNMAPTQRVHVSKN